MGYTRVEKVKIGGFEIGAGASTFVICEAGVTNYGELSLAKRQVDAAVAAGASVVKFQAWRTEDLVSKKVAKRLEGELGYDWFERVKYKELSLAGLKELQRYCREKGIEFFATSHDDWSLKLLTEEFDVPFLKIGSGESNNWDFLEAVGKTKKPVLISFGMQREDEAKRAVDILFTHGAPAVVGFHCVSIYPTPAAAADLPRIARLKESLGIPIGISDHTIGWHVPVAAVALGACAVEKHLTFDKQDARSIDNPGALLPEEFKEMVHAIRDVEKAVRPISADEREQLLSKAREWALQSIVAVRELSAGTVLTREMIAFKRPAKGGIPASDVDSVIGRELKVSIVADEQIKQEHLL